MTNSVCVCVHAHMCMCVHACVRTCMHVCGGWGGKELHCTLAG